MKVSKTEIYDIFVTTIIYAIVDFEKLIIKLPSLSFLFKLVSRLISVVAML